MIDTTTLHDRQLTDILLEMINEINTLDTEIKRIKSDLHHIKESEDKQ